MLNDKKLSKLLLKRNMNRLEKQYRKHHTINKMNNRLSIKQEWIKYCFNIRYSINKEIYDTLKTDNKSILNSF